MKRINMYLLMSLLMLFTQTALLAKDPPVPGPPPPPGLPIDSGLIYLLISGVFLGVYVLRKKG